VWDWDTQSVTTEPAGMFRETPVTPLTPRRSSRAQRKEYVASEIPT
jgi:hypothetical protein